MLDTIVGMLFPLIAVLCMIALTVMAIIMMIVAVIEDRRDRASKKRPSLDVLRDSYFGGD